jgi:predicted nucleotidyltransferase
MTKLTNTKSIKQIRAFLQNESKIKQAILFGSYAKATQMEDSDIDLAIQLEKPMTAIQKLAYVERLQNCTDTEIDLIDLLTVGQPLLSQIMKYGKRLKGNSTQYAKLAVRNVNTTQDFMPAIKYIMKARRERLLNG